MTRIPARRRLVLAIALLSTPAQPFAQQLVRDINAQPAENPSSSPGSFLNLGDHSLFAARVDGQGLELWLTDGVQAELVEDVRPGPGGSLPRALLDLGGGRALFFASHPLFGFEPWVFDLGTGEAQLLRDILPGADSSSAVFGAITVAPELFGGQGVFRASDGEHGYELWQTDGTSAGTSLLVDVEPGIASSSPNELTAIGSKLFFVAADYVTGGQRLVVWDGAQVTDLGAQFPRQLTAAGGQLFFAQGSSFGDVELWVSDGTPAGTGLVVELNTGGSADVDQLVAVGDEVFFVADSDADGYALFRSDGTAAGTSLVLDASPGAGAAADYHDLTPFAGGALLLHRDGDLTDVWFTDGTPGGNHLITTTDAYTSGFAVAGGVAYFRVGDGAEPRQLWTTDGLAAAPLGLSFEVIGVLDPTTGVLGDRILFSASDGSTGAELWTSDGTTAGTSLVADLAPAPGSASSSPEHLTAFGEHLLFTSDDGVHGEEVWISDGTDAGTTLLVDVLPGPDGSQPGPFHVVGDEAYFGARTAPGVHGLWVTDGTPAGTQLVVSGLDGPVDTFFQIGGTTVLRIGNSLLALDASPAGATELYNGTITSLQRVQGRLYWSGTLPGFGHELLVSDGKTVAVAAELTPGPAPDISGGPSLLTSTDDAVYFAGEDALGSKLLRRYDVATGALSTISESSGGLKIIDPMRGAGGHVYFGANIDPNVGYELYRTDGTTIELVFDANTGPKSGLVADTQPRLVGGHVVFLGRASDDYVRAYSTDGTSGVTVVLSDGTFLPDVAPPLEMLGTSNTALFGDESFTLDTLGTELWLTDGTVSGTKLLADLATGAASSSPAGFERVGNRVFFSAHGEFGRELWSMPFTLTEGSAWDTLGLGCPDGAGGYAGIALADFPATGTQLTVELLGATPNAPALLLAAIAPTPLDLLGCTLQVGANFVLAGQEFTDTDGAALNPLTVPNAPGLVGVPVVLQWFVSDPGGDFLGLGGTTPGLEFITSF